jgi:hypothetical protein
VARRRDQELDTVEDSLDDDVEEVEDLDDDEDAVELGEDDVDIEHFEGDSDDDETGDDDGDDDGDDEYAASDDDSDQTSLEELLAQRSARRGTGESDDETDILALVSDRQTIEERVSSRVIPMKDRQEFVCTRCRLVKPRVQLADPERGLCRDCV